MKIKQLGNGGAFDYNQTNSSFLIELETNDYLLFDCGYNVFSKLRELGDDIIKDINNVFISHMDDDHMGSLKSLIYYRYFMLGKSTSIIYSQSIGDVLELYLKDVNFTLKDGNKVPTEIFRIKSTQYFKNVYFNVIEGVHGKPSAGILINKFNEEYILISGDTKANMNFYRAIKSIPKDKSFIIFHDYSNWNNESEQVHACEEDFNLIYAPYLDNINKYHTGAKFNEEWITLDKG